MIGDSMGQMLLMWAISKTSSRLKSDQFSLALVGIQTLVGVTLPALSPQNGTANGNFYLDGDGNQEYIDNLSVEVWNSTNGYCGHLNFFLEWMHLQ